MGIRELNSKQVVHIDQDNLKFVYSWFIYKDTGEEKSWEIV